MPLEYDMEKRVEPLVCQAKLYQTNVPVVTNFGDYKAGKKHVEEYNALPLGTKKLITRITYQMGEQLSREEVFNAARRLHSGQRA